MKYWAGLLLAVATVAASGSASGEGAGFRWPNGEGAAVSLTYDDALDVHLDHAAPDLEAADLRGTFYVSGASRSLYERLDAWRGLAERGHELGNHTIFHPCLKTAPHGSVRAWARSYQQLEDYSVRQIKEELRAMNTTLTAIDGKRVRTYAYTCSDTVAGGESYVDALRPYFLAARVGEDAVVDDLQKLDVHRVPSLALRDASADEMIAFVEKAIDAGGLAVLMFHGVGGGHEMNVSREAHRAVLTWLDQNRERVWTAPFRDVMEHVVAERKRLGGSPD